MIQTESTQEQKIERTRKRRETREHSPYYCHCRCADQKGHFSRSKQIHFIVIARLD